MAEGLIWGDVPISREQVLNAVNLTTGKSPEGNGVFAGGVLTAEDRATIERRDGQKVPENARFPDKRAINGPEAAAVVALLRDDRARPVYRGDTAGRERVQGN